MTAISDDGRRERLAGKYLVGGTGVFFDAQTAAAALPKKA